MTERQMSGASPALATRAGGHLNPVPGINSLRNRILLLLVATVLAMLSLAVYLALKTRQDNIEHATQRLRATAQFLAEQQNDTTAYAKQFLGFLAETRGIREFAASPRCPTFLAEKLKREPRFTNIAIVAPNGNVVCTAVPTPGVVNLGDRDYFKKALSAPDYVIGEAIVGRSSGKWALPVVTTMRDEAGRVRNVLLVALDLHWVSNQLERGDYAADARLGLIDAKGLVVAGRPDPEAWVGKSASQTVFFRMLIEHIGTGAAEAPGFDGAQRIYGFAQFAETVAGPIYLWIGLPKSYVVKDANREFAWTVSVALVLITLTFALTWIGGERLILRPVSAMADAARRLGAGDYRARTGLRYGKDELGGLARSFDAMADALVSRSEILRLNRTLQVVSGTNHAIVRAKSEQDLFEEICRVAVEHGQFGMARIALLDAQDRALNSVAQQGIWQIDSEKQDGSNSHVQKAAAWMAPAIREDRLTICDFEATPPVSGWDRDAALHGASGCAAIPVRRGAKVIGTLMLYATLPGFFDTSQRALLADMGEDFSFAMDRFALEAQRTGMEAELRASEARFAAVFRVNPISMSITRFTDGLYIDINDAFLRLFGYAREEVIGNTSVQLRVWATAEDRARVLGMVREQGQILNFEMLFRRKDGEIRSGLISAEGIMLGEETYVLALLQDITERKRAEAELHASGVELHRQLEELRRFKRVAVDRELHMKELKAQNRRLEEQLATQAKART